MRGGDITQSLSESQCHLPRGKTACVHRLQSRGINYIWIFPISIALHGTKPLNFSSFRVSFASSTTMATEQISFRKYLPDLNTPRFQTAKEQTPYEYTNKFHETHHPPWLHNLTETWKELLKEPFTGVTNDGMPLRIRSLIVRMCANTSQAP